jgi:hypothetical protein
MILLKYLFIIIKNLNFIFYFKNLKIYFNYLLNFKIQKILDYLTKVKIFLN